MAVPFAHLYKKYQYSVRFREIPLLPSNTETAVSGVAFDQSIEKKLKYAYTFPYIMAAENEDCLLYLGISQTYCCNLPTTSSIVKFDIFEVIRPQNVLTYERYLCCLQ